MISDLALCDLCASLYDPAQNAGWTHLWPDDGAYCAIKRLDDGTDVVVYRGSISPVDWFLDLDELVIYAPGVGRVHAGFWVGVAHSWALLKPLLGPNVIVTGHSLGAARAALFAALAKSAGITVQATVGFGQPRPGFAEIAASLEIPNARWYRNREDPVTFVPFLGGLYQHAGAKVQVDAPPAEGHQWGPLASHHVMLYRQGIAKLAA